MADGVLNNLRILHKRYSTVDWENHVLQAGELGLDLTKKEVRIGTAADQVWSEAQPVGRKITVTSTGSGNVVTNVTWTANTDTLAITKGNVVSSFAVSDDNVVDGAVNTSVGGVTLTLSHAKKGPTSAFTGTASSDHTLNIPKINVDIYGHVTAVENQTITIPTLAAGTADGSLKLSDGADVKVTGWDALVGRVNGNTTAYTYKDKGDTQYETDLKNKNKFKVGDTIYFIQEGVKDQWVGAVLSEADDSGHWYTLYDIEADTSGIVHGTGLTANQVVVGNGGSSVKILPPGTNNYILKMVSGTPTWAAEYSYTLPKATTGALGGIKIGYTETSKNYAVKLDDNGAAFVTVPWANTTYTGGDGVKLSGTKFVADLANATKATAAATYTAATAATNFYAVQLDSAGHLGVNVPWKNTTYTGGNGVKLSGTQFVADLTDATKAGVAAKYVKATAATQFYAVQLDSAGHLGVDVPWANTTYGADRGITLVSGKFGHSNAAPKLNDTTTQGTHFGAVSYDTYGHITAFTEINTLDGNDAVAA